MRNHIEQPVYSQIAMDIASRIAKGELKEGTKIAGRSLLASEYNVSPETIRRSLRLLEDMEIIEVLTGSGVTIKSRTGAMQYIEKYNTGKDLRALKGEIYEKIRQREGINQEISEIIDQMFDLSERLRNINPIHIIEVEVPINSPLVGKMIADVRFWQRTGATIVGIKREGKLIVSPGPYACFMPMDIFLVIGDPGVLKRIEQVMNEG
ncbi:MAG TPA: TrkA C-terminal domain-containing protein [Methylomusa anaerophila]|uniref:Mannosyl-D-glycerate transport/metabolism system repressor MngR n=1 Tax=Methylomusa anaerophila TaxID=1930071 RepID=A0A348AI59_9FIRM|nr:TrkA C-terminal domain-containing protein [Methylomusa anaerophila]BBB90757.1 mannosyl-D-glycerate transport/metabolism system repressor MngR [Methylomusa anaerophila]HML88639.1 TrkA C-terminal domain-containing protein [Methylomusa anaerophila]